MAKEQEYDDAAAIKFILASLPNEMKTNISDDDVLYILDLICEYYDKNDLMDDDNADVEIAEDDMHNFIWAAIKKEKIVSLSEDEMQAILDGEFEYGKKIGLYTEAE